MPRYIGAYRGGVRPSAPTIVYHTCALSLPCHSEPVTDVTGVGIRSPRPQARNPPRLPLRGIVISGRGRAVRPYTRSDVPCERPLPLPLGEVAERSEDGEGKP